MLLSLVYKTTPERGENGSITLLDSRMPGIAESVRRLDSCTPFLFLAFVRTIISNTSPPDMWFSFQDGKENKNDGGLLRVRECITAQS